MNNSKPNLDEIYRTIMLFRRDFMVNHLEKDFEIFIYMSQELEYKLRVWEPIGDIRNICYYNSIMGYRYSIDMRMKELEFKCVIQKKDSFFIEKNKMENENTEKMIKDSDQIFKLITSGNFTDYKMAEKAVVFFYAMDTLYSRAGISHALKRLEKHYKGN